MNDENIKINITFSDDIDNKTKRSAKRKINNFMKYQTHTWKEVDIDVIATRIFIHITEHSNDMVFLVDESIWDIWHKNNQGFLME